MKGSSKKFKLVHPKDVMVNALYKEKIINKSGIIITVNPSIVDDRPTEGIVVAKGKEVDIVDIGDHIYFSYKTGQDIYFDDDKEQWFIMMAETRILGKSND